MNTWSASTPLLMLPSSTARVTNESPPPSMSIWTWVLPPPATARRKPETPVLTGHAYNQLLDLALDSWSARASTRPRAIELAGNKLAIPAQDGVRPGYGGDVGENLAAQAMTDLAERLSGGVRELQPTCQPGLENAVFDGQIFVPRQQFLVHRPGRVRPGCAPNSLPPLPPEPRRLRQSGTSYQTAPRTAI
jgi:hypothetical protein